MKILKMFLPALFVISVILNCSCFAENTNYPENLWKGLIGEAASEFTDFGELSGYKSMYATACVYRNRIRLKMSLGCVALKGLI